MSNKSSIKQVGQSFNDFLLTKIIQNSVIQHTLFWVLSFYILLRFFAYETQLYPVDFIYTLLFHLSLVFIVYINLLVLIPRLLNRQRYLFYLLAVAVLLLIGIYANQLTFQYLADLLFPGYYFISYYNFLDIAQFFLIYLTFTTLLKLSKAWFTLDQQKRLVSQMEREKLDSELSALKRQIDPHFFFNSLNNLYSLALDQDVRTADGILKLSQIMRYILYECQAPSVPLSKEIEHIQNYLELQRLRLNTEAQINLTLSGDFSNAAVAPLLFIPFIENGFKHGLKGNGTEAYIHISFTLEGQTLIFQTQNDKGQADQWTDQKHQGIGIKNTRRRLALLYPKKHELEIVDEAKHFNVQLKLTLS